MIQYDRRLHYSGWYKCRGGHQEYLVGTTRREWLLRNKDAHGRGKECLPETSRPSFISTMSPDLSQPTHRLEETDTLRGIHFVAALRQGMRRKKNNMPTRQCSCKATTLWLGFLLCTKLAGVTLAEQEVWLGLMECYRFSPLSPLSQICCCESMTSDENSCSIETDRDMRNRTRFRHRFWSF